MHFIYIQMQFKNSRFEAGGVGFRVIKKRFNPILTLRIAINKTERNIMFSYLRKHGEKKCDY